MKMNKKLGKVLAIIMILSIFVMNLITVVLASGPAVKPDDSYDTAGDTAYLDDVKKFGGGIITTISTIGSMGAIIFLIILGIKYMMGSAEERAEYKKTLMPYFIGAIMVFGASALAGIIYSIAGGIGSGGTSA